MAERVGFEPTIEFPLYTRSRRAPSTTRPPLQIALSDGSLYRSDRRAQGPAPAPEGFISSRPSSCRAGRASRQPIRRPALTGGGQRRVDPQASPDDKPEGSTRTTAGARAVRVHPLYRGTYTWAHIHGHIMHGQLPSLPKRLEGSIFLICARCSRLSWHPVALDRVPCRARLPQRAPPPSAIRRADLEAGKRETACTS